MIWDLLHSISAGQPSVFHSASCISDNQLHLNVYATLKCCNLADHNISQPGSCERLSSLSHQVGMHPNHSTRLQLFHKQLVAACRFEWVDGPLTRAIELGQWVLLENANLCNPAVLDRLNSLFEPGGSLLLNEAGTAEGQARLLQPHPDFRLFMTLDPRSTSSLSSMFAVHSHATDVQEWQARRGRLLWAELCVWRHMHTSMLVYGRLSCHCSNIHTLGQCNKAVPEERSVAAGMARCLRRCAIAASSSACCLLCQSIRQEGSLAPACLSVLCAPPLMMSACWQLRGCLAMPSHMQWLQPMLSLSVQHLLSGRP